MNIPPEKELKLRNLVSSLLNNEISDADFLYLDQLITTDAEARQFYVSYMDMHASLASILGSTTEKSDAISNLDTLKNNDPNAQTKQSEIRAANQSSAPLPLENSQSSLLPADGNSASHNPSVTNWVDFGKASGLFIVMVAMGLLAFVFAPIFRDKDPAANPQIAAVDDSQKSQPTGTTADDTKFIARVTNSWDTVWGENTKNLKKNALLAAEERIELTGGLVEVTFECGAVVIVQAPATFVVKASNGGVLESGKMTARVPGPSAKFWVVTPSMKILDLGTEFGISADANTSQVRVFEGAVEVEPISNKTDSSNRKLIKAGQIGFVEPINGYTESKADIDANGMFVRDMPNSIEDNFTNTIIKARPWGYWSFNSAITSTLIPDMSGHGRFAQLLNDAMVVQSHSISAIGQAASLNERRSDSILIPTGSTFSTQKDFSIEILFRTVTGGVLASKTPLDGSWKPGSKILFVRGGMIRFSAFDSKSPSKRKSVQAKDLVNDNRWHHVVLVNKANVSRSLDQTTLYVDGVKRATCNDWNITTDDDRKMPLRLGTGSQSYPTNDINKATHFPTHNHLTGSIDEAAVYERCLSLEEVVSHYRDFLMVGINRREATSKQSSLISDDTEEDDNSNN